MKTYLLDTVKRIKRFSQSLDVSTILCNKSWVVFNDSGDKELLIFNSDKTVLITNNGIGVNKTWNWVPANKSLTINMEDGTIIMLHPEFVNDTILALNLDGTQKYSFLIEENNRKNFAPHTLNELQEYFEEIETKAIAAEKSKQQKEEKSKKEKKLKEKADEILFWADTLKFFLFFIALVLFIKSLFTAPENPKLAVLFLIIFIILIWLGIYIRARKVKKYKLNHPDDPVNDYL